LRIRIVGGNASGLKIEAPAGKGTRPTGERVREAIFNSLVTLTPEAKVLDLYGGSGAMGLESVSWGSNSCIIVEPSRLAQTVIRANIARLHMQQSVHLWPVSAEAALPKLLAAASTFDIIICDPPWADALSMYVRDHLQHVLAEAGVVLVEHPAAQECVPISGLKMVRQRTYGSTAVSYWRFN
jgi:16S rRNA (guanine966-N2)-methyltransferase